MTWWHDASEKVDDVPVKLKVANRLVEQIEELKLDGLCDAGITTAIGVNLPTFTGSLRAGRARSSR